MACAANFVRQLPRACIAISSSTPSFRDPKIFFYANFEPLKSFPKNLRLLLCNRVSNFRFTFSGAHRRYLQSSPFRGGQLTKGIISGASILIGSISFRPIVSLAIDDRFLGDRQEDLDDLVIGKPGEMFRKFAAKLWVPIIFCLTVLANLDQPLTLVVTKVILFLLSTKPCPLSVYIFVDQVCHSSCQGPHLYNRKSLYASKVEVEDYKVLCVARVEINQQKFTLLGILGGWWALPSLTPAGEFNPFTNIALKHHRLFI